MTRRWIAPEYGGIDALELVDGELPPPAAGEVSIRVTAAGVNPSDAKVLTGGWNADPALLPLPVGQEVTGVVTAVGPGTRIASGPVAVGDAVVAWKIAGGFATEVTVSAADVFVAPPGVDDAVLANILHVGTVAEELLHLVTAHEGETLLVHGASGSVGILVTQLAVRRGMRVIGTAGAARAAAVERFGATVTRYGEGLADRVRALAPRGVDAAIDAAGTPEALAVSLEIVADPSRIATVAPGPAAREAGVRVSAGALPASVAYRTGRRTEVLRAVGAGELTLPVAATFPFTEAKEALRLVATGHPGGKVALLP